MIPIPAIDLKDGKVVRLLHGDFKEEKVYSEKAEEVARRFEADGAARIHVVDLDGALKGTPKNSGVVEALASKVRVPIEIGGGIRDLKTAERYIAMGISWVVLGTKACLDLGFLKEAVGEFGTKIIVGLDALDGYLATDGWTQKTKIKAIEYAAQVKASGGKTVIYTDISKDGALKGPNLKGIEALSKAVDLDVIASGGVSSLADLKAIAEIGQKNITGAIIGKALYENKFTLKDAIKTCLPNG